MDIHRCRFVPYPASAINALAFSHTSVPGNTRVPSTLRLAIGRANGDIEIWDPRNGIWVQETIIKGGKDRSIEGLAWTQDLDEEAEDGHKSAGRLRLFSIGYSTVVTEWDLSKGVPLQHSSGNYGDIWCMAAQPRWQNLQKDAASMKKQGSKLNQLLAIGCGDGTLILHSTVDGQLRYERTLPRPSGKKARALSLAFQSRQKIVAGFSDSTIRIFDVHGKGQVINMSLGSGAKKGPQAILVWTVKCLNDGTIVSGDSTGEIKFWDSKTNALVQRLRGHEADVLDISTSMNGMSVMSGGMDRRTVLYRRKMDGNSKGRWSEVLHKRVHESDVKAMASYECQGFSVTASGGLDTNPIIIPQHQLGQEDTRRLPTFPTNPPLDSAPAKRLITSWWDREVNVWRLDPLSNSALVQGFSTNALESRQLVAKIAVQGEESITASAITANGDLLAVATITSLKVFRLRDRKSDDSLKVVKMDIDTALGRLGAREVRFSPDSKWLLVVRPDSKVEMVRVKQNDNEDRDITFSSPIRLRRRQVVIPARKVADGTLGDYPRSITRVAWSSDSRLLVTGDLEGNLDAWVLKGNEDVAQQDVDEDISDSSSSEDEEDVGKEPRLILGQNWTKLKSRLPQLPASPAVLSFRPTTEVSDSTTPNGNIGLHATRHNPHPHPHDLPDTEDRLLVITTRHQILELSVMSGRLTDWSRRNPSSCLPREFKETRDRAMGCMWDVSDSKQRIWIYGSAWLWMFDLSRNMEVEDDTTLGNGELVETGPNKKRKRDKLDRKERIKQSSGAGNAVPDKRRETGHAGGMNTIENGTSKYTSFYEKGRKTKDSEEEDDVDLSSGENESSELTKLRRNISSETASRGKDVSTDNTESAANEKVAEDQGPPYWRTFKYRPILGLVPLTSQREEDGEGSGGQRNIEVALIERPAWDLDLAPRWEPEQDWKKQ